MPDLLIVNNKMLACSDDTPDILIKNKTSYSAGTAQSTDSILTISAMAESPLALATADIWSQMLRWRFHLTTAAAIPTEISRAARQVIKVVRLKCKA